MHENYEVTNISTVGLAPSKHAANGSTLAIYDGPVISALPVQAIDPCLLLMCHVHPCKVVRS